MSLDDQSLKELEELACLRLSKEERQRLREKLERVLAYVEQLRAVDTEGVEATSHVMERGNVMREDQIVPSLARERALAAAPKHRDGFFELPPVMDRDDGKDS